MVGQHDPTRPDADRARSAGDVADHDRGRRTRDPGHIVMFGQPETVVAPALGVLREVERVAQRIGGRAALDDRREIEYREGYGSGRHRS